MRCTVAGGIRGTKPLSLPPSVSARAAAVALCSKGEVEVVVCNQSPSKGTKTTRTVDYATNDDKLGRHSPAPKAKPKLPPNSAQVHACRHVTPLHSARPPPRTCSAIRTFSYPS
mgnify:CR=1 FL=1